MTAFLTLALGEAFQFLDQGRRRDAEERFDEILGLSPLLPEALYGRLLARNDPDDGRHADLLIQVIDQDVSAYPSLLLRAGDWFMRQGRADVASRAFDAARRQLAADSTIALAYGACRLELGDASAAECEARAILREVPSNAKALFLLGRALICQRRAAEAVEPLRTAAKVKPRSQEIRDHLAYALLLAENWEEAAAVVGPLGSPADAATAVTLFVAAGCCARAGELLAAEKLYLSVLGSADYMAARGRVLQGVSPKSGDLADEILRRWWPAYSQCLRAQGWFDQALAESKAPINSLQPIACPEIRIRQRQSLPGAPRVILVSFSSNDFFRFFQEGLSSSALESGGFDEAVVWTAQSLSQTQFFQQHSTILARPRGAGLWAWKPYIIYNEFLRRPDGDYVIYYDCGRKGNTFTKPIQEIISWCERSEHGILPGVIARAAGPNERWTKRDCFRLMDADSPAYWERPQVQATFSVWKNSAFARAFVLEWVRLAVDPRLISDHPNVCGEDNRSGLLDHRHDQSIVTNLVVRHGLSLPEYSSKDINGLGAVLSGRVPA